MNAQPGQAIIKSGHSVKARRILCYDNLKNSNVIPCQNWGLNFIMKGKAPAIRLQAEPQRDYYSKIRGLIMNK